MLYRSTQAFWYCRLSNRKLKQLYAEHFEVMKEEATRGNPTAMYLLGRTLHVQEKDLSLAKEWFLKAIAAGDIQSYINLGTLSPRDGADLEYLKKGCETNDNRGLWVMGRLLRKGSKGIDQDFQEALRFMNRISSDYPRCKEDLAWLTAKVQNSPQKFPAEVSHYLVEGAKMGDRKSIEALSDFLDD